MMRNLSFAKILISYQIVVQNYLNNNFYTEILTEKVDLWCVYCVKQVEKSAYQFFNCK